MPESRPFTGIDFGFRAGSSTALYYSSIKNGTFNVCTDTGDLYIDINDQRIATKDIISMSREADILRLTNPYQRIYYAEDTYNLWRYDNVSRTWKQVAGETTKYAEKAKKDNNGNVINTYYYTKNEAAAKDSEYQSTFDDIYDILENINSFEIEIVNSFEDLPAVGEKGVIYFVPKGGTAPDVYDEYIWNSRDEVYEKIGISTADLTDYYTKSQVDTKFNSYYKKTQTYSSTQIDDKLATKSDTNHTHNNFTYATATQNGTPGFVPAPSSGQYDYILTAHGWDINSGTVEHALSTDYATNAGTATSATNAGTALYANKSGTATYANKSGTATYANNAGRANNAGTADYATNSGTATVAINSTYASTSDYASSAGYVAEAAYSLNSDRARIADHAINATSADYSTSAEYDSNGKFISSYISSVTYTVVNNGKAGSFTFKKGDNTELKFNIGTFTTATASAHGKPGLVPAPTTEQRTGYILTSEGWSNNIVASTISHAESADTATYDNKGNTISNYINGAALSTSYSGKAASFSFTKGNNTTVKFNLTTFVQATTATVEGSTVDVAGKPGLVPAPTTAQKTKDIVLTPAGWSSIATVAYATKSGSVTSATSATKDNGDREIAKTYFSSVSVATATDAATTLTLKAPGNTTGSTVAIRNDNNKYSEASTAAAGLIKKISTTNGAVYTSNGTQGSWTTNAGSVAYAAKTAAATMSTYATKDNGDREIAKTYFSSVSVATATDAATTLTLKAPGNTTGSTVAIRNDNNKYSEASTAAAGLIKKISTTNGAVYTSNGTQGSWTTNAGSVAYAAKTAAATMSTYATKDSASNTITETYFNNVSTSTNANGTTITLKRPAGTTAVNISIPGSTYGVVTKNNDGLVPKSSSVTGYVFTSNGSSGIWTKDAGSVAYAISATKDAGNREIAKTYFSSVSASTATNKPTTLTFSTPGSQTSTVVAWNTTYSNFKNTSATTDSSGTTYSGAAAGLAPSPGNSANALNGKLVLTSKGWSTAASVAYANSANTATSAGTATYATYAPGSTVREIRDVVYSVNYSADSNAASISGLYLDGDQWSKTISTFTNATASANGKVGLVPAPITSQRTKDTVLTPTGWSNTASVAYATYAQYVSGANESSGLRALNRTYWNISSSTSVSGFIVEEYNGSTYIKEPGLLDCGLLGSWA